MAVFDVPSVTEARSTTPQILLVVDPIQAELVLSNVVNMPFQDMMHGGAADVGVVALPAPVPGPVPHNALFGTFKFSDGHISEETRWLSTVRF